MKLELDDNEKKHLRKRYRTQLVAAKAGNANIRTQLHAALKLLYSAAVRKMWVITDQELTEGIESIIDQLLDGFR